MRAALLAAGLSGVAGSLAACASDTSTGITDAELTCPTDSSLTYATFGAAFVSEYCLSCHTSKERPTLTTQAQVQANKAAILAEAVKSTAMPEGGTLTIEQRKLLGEWLSCGAP